MFTIEKALFLCVLAQGMYCHWGKINWLPVFDQIGLYALLCFISLKRFFFQKTDQTQQVLHFYFFFSHISTHNDTGIVLNWCHSEEIQSEHVIVHMRKGKYHVQHK